MKNFITFEGGEGTGKSTQSKLLFNSISKVTKKVFLTREPGGTKLSELLRDLLVKKNLSWEPITEILLINAARNEHIQKFIIPKLSQKNIIICDRYIDSTYAYQIKAQKVNKKIFEILNRIVVKKIIPNTTFLIDVDPKIGVKRSLSRKNSEIKYENYELSFHKKIRKSFLDSSKKNKRFFVLDGNQKIEKIHRLIIDKINKKNITKNKIPYSL
ncbi:dTMP kinase [Rickettsiales bacterium]|nr:dTMP kinase [Rickettsiales bacterium]